MPLYLALLLTVLVKGVLVLCHPECSNFTSNGTISGNDCKPLCDNECGRNATVQTVQTDTTVPTAISCTHKHLHYYNRENRERGIIVGVACAVIIAGLVVALVFLFRKRRWSVMSFRRMSSWRATDNTAFTLRDEQHV
nr:hypothetical protein BgiMline_016421 [Biomphalaria glabrata]